MLYELLAFLTGWVVGVYNGRETILSAVTSLPSAWLSQLIVIYGHGRNLATRWENWRMRWRNGGNGAGNSEQLANGPRLLWRKVYGFSNDLTVQLLGEFDDQQAQRLDDLGVLLKAWQRTRLGEGKEPWEGFIVDYQWRGRSEENLAMGGHGLLENRQRYFLVVAGGVDCLLADGSWLGREVASEYSELDTNLPEDIEARELWQRLEVWGGPNGQYGQELPEWQEALLTKAIQIVNGPESPYPFYYRLEGLLEPGQWIKLIDPLLERCILIGERSSPRTPP